MSTVPTITANLVLPEVTHGQTQFNSEMNTYHQQTILMVDEMNDGVIPGINTAVTDTAVNLSRAVQASVQAIAASSAAVYAANATEWVTGQVYDRMECAVDPVTFQTYRNSVAGSSTTRPALNSNWLQISGAGDNNYFGVAYNTVTDTFIRVGTAEGIAVGQFCGTNVSPILAALRRVVLTDAGSVYKGISWTDKTKHEDGTNVDLSGTNGQIMVEFLPAYYRSYVLGDWQYTLFSHLPLAGFTLHPAFTGYSALYMGAYEASTYSDKLCSIAKSPADGVANVFPVTKRTGDWGHAGLTTAVTNDLATARGSGWLAGDMLMQIYYRQLLVAAFATYNIPGVVGAGRTNLSGGTWTNDSYIGKCGIGDATGGYYSSVQAGGAAGYLTDYAQVLGIENPWGNVWERVNNSLVNSGELYYKTTSPASGDYAAVTGWTRLINPIGSPITLPLSNGWSGKPNSGLGNVFPADVTGSSSTKMFDYFYYAAGLMVLLVGGDAYSGANAGAFSWAAYSAAYTTAAFGGRLCFKKAV